MSDVPDQAIARRVENIMDRGGQLDHAKAGGGRGAIGWIARERCGVCAQRLEEEVARIFGEPGRLQRS